jgi:glycosyltransferase involved in cell wall biosynthesis
MKIAHLAYADGGGGAFKAAYRIHRGVRGLGLESQMLVAKKITGDADVFDAGSALGRLWAHAATYLDVAPFRLLRVPRSEFASLAWVRTRATRRLAGLGADIVHLHWICGGLIRIEELARITQPIVWRLADMWPLAGAEHYVGADTRYQRGYRRDNRPPGEKGIDLNRWVFERKARAYATIPNLTIVTPSRWLARCARESALLRGRRVEVIPTGQDLHAYRPIPKAWARELLRLPPDGKFIMTASTNLGDKRKGVAYMLEALAPLDVKTHRLMLLGSPPAKPVDCPLPIHYLGRLDDDLSLAIAYSAADVFVAPSLEENLANTVIEAMACGVPCVAFDIGGMPDIIHHGGNGFLAAPFDADGLRRNILAAIGSADFQAQLGAAARATVEAEFSEELQARRYAELYHDLLGRAG